MPVQVQKCGVHTLHRARNRFNLHLALSVTLTLQEPCRWSVGYWKVYATRSDRHNSIPMPIIFYVVILNIFHCSTKFYQMFFFCWGGGIPTVKHDTRANSICHSLFSIIFNNNMNTLLYLSPLQIGILTIKVLKKFFFN